MGQTTCLYCGKKITDDVAECPHCGGISHYQRSGYRAGARKRFILLFIGVVIFCAFFAFWLPQQENWGKLAPNAPAENMQGEKSE